MSTRLQLDAGTQTRVAGGIGTRITVRSGFVWVTQAADERDIILAADDCFVVDRDGLTVMSALGGPASVGIDPVLQTAVVRGLHADSRAVLEAA